MAHTDSEVTDVLDEGASAATVSISGLGLFCFNEQGAFEGAFVRLPSHQYVIRIEESGAAGAKPRIRVFGLDGDVDIKVINPASEGARRFESGGFNRTAQGNDPRDFRWIIDMEGPEMHATEVEPAPARGVQEGGRRLSRLTISDGTFYTKSVSQDQYARVRVDDPDAPPQLLGSIADDIGVEVECGDGSGSGLLVTISNGGETQVFLPKQPGVKYQITFSNDCPEPEEEPQSSDFRLFYDILRDPEDRQFDLARAVGQNHPKAAGGFQLDDDGTLFKDGYGLVCDTVYLGRTSSLSQFS